MASDEFADEERFSFLDGGVVKTSNKIYSQQVVVVIYANHQHDHRNMMTVFVDLFSFLAQPLLMGHSFYVASNFPILFLYWEFELCCKVYSSSIFFLKINFYEQTTMSTLDKDELKFWLEGLYKLDLSLAVFESTIFLFVSCCSFVNLSRRRLKLFNILLKLENLLEENNESYLKIHNSQHLLKVISYHAFGKGIFDFLVCFIKIGELVLLPDFSKGIGFERDDLFWFNFECHSLTQLDHLLSRDYLYYQYHYWKRNHHSHWILNSPLELDIVVTDTKIIIYLTHLHSSVRFVIYNI
ncbi:hypothetical protein AGLY_007958 [Aphis glycines]|uniref:Uncharacterized protein n=1 Tax=Aphis glycines TaxID=307491 RepID=A0A6G0TN18_APHGL|nr:hypothetical protein AGLY_007958 [Aphis glycines]